MDLVLEGNPLEVPPELLGLFVGASQLEQSDEALEQVRVTLDHELGHFLGFDEEGVEAMGLG